MPNIKSAIKRVKTSEYRRKKNASAKSALRTTIKKCNESTTNNDESSGNNLKTAVKALQKAASKKLIHKNTAARRISKLTKAFNSSNN